ncbi:MAG TPA: YraN family protein [Anaeromyxobacteraceae bacterium]|nr:YraN family protein [Anaeromyxobacteraceae bacterium]
MHDPRSRTQLGQAAEDAAATWLEAQGFRVVARNHRARRGEVDLVCEEGGTLCFVEVRSRSRLDFGGPQESVTQRKARRVADAALDWALRNGATDRPARFDVVAVDMSEGTPRFELFRGAFDAAGRPML